MATFIEPKCPFGDLYVCVCGIRYEQTNGKPADPRPQDLPGLLYRGECIRCVKATGGLR